MEETRFIRRRIEVILDKYGKYGLVTEILSTPIMLISGYFQFGANFSSSLPSTFLGVNVNPFYLTNLSLIIFSISATISIGGFILWIATLNSPPLVVIKPSPSSYSASLLLKTNETKDISDIKIRIISFADEKHGIEYARAIHSTIEYVDVAIKGQEVFIPIAKMIGEDLTIITKDYYPVPLTLDSVEMLEREEEVDENFNVVMEVSVLLRGEAERRNAGIYMGVIEHHQGYTPKMGGFFKNKNIIKWKNGSFLRINERKSNAIVKKNLALQP